MLVEPELQESLSHLLDEQRQLVRGFQVAWDLLDSLARMRMLPEAVEEVRHREADSMLDVRLDMDGLKSTACIACVAAPCIQRSGAPNAARSSFPGAAKPPFSARISEAPREEPHGVA